MGGIERVTIVKANALAEIPGNEVAICYTDKGGFPKTIHPLSAKIKTFDLGTPYWGLVGAVKKLVGFIPLVFKTRRALLNVMENFRPDVVITTGSYEKYALALVNSHCRIDGGKPLKIREFHFSSTYRRYLGTSWLQQVSARITEAIEKHLLSRFYDKSYVLTRADMEKNFNGNRRFDFMYNPTSFIPDKVPPYQTRVKTILTVGRLTEGKNVEALLSVWIGVHEKCPGWKLRIVGDGNMRDNLIKQAIDGGVADSVEFPGRLFDIEGEMGRASIYAMTSKYEGFPLVLLEAQTMGLPIISYNTPYGPAEIVSDTVDGLIVEYDNMEQFKAKLLQLTSDYDMRDRMSENAREHSREFAPEVIISKWMDKYTQLLSSK